jgi:hypothetical protein
VKTHFFVTNTFLMLRSVIGTFTSDVRALIQPLVQLFVQKRFESTPHYHQFTPLSLYTSSTLSVSFSDIQTTELFIILCSFIMSFAIYTDLCIIIYQVKRQRFFHPFKQQREKMYMRSGYTPGTRSHRYQQKIKDRDKGGFTDI